MRLMTSKAAHTPPCLPTKALLLPFLLFTLGLFPTKIRGQENSSSTAQPDPGLYNPVANPKAVVILGHARFTVLTPQMIRMEWSADGKFEDHASWVFLNRDMPVPPFTHTVKHGAHGQVLTLSTDALKLTYDATRDGDGKFTADNLQVSLQLDGKEVTWHPGMAATGNLQGTTRTLDGARGDKTAEPIGQGLISRDGWVVVDDSKRPLFDSTDFQFKQGENSPWPWVLPRPTGDHQDWYFFGYGHHYKEALGRLCESGGANSIAAAFRVRHLVVALLGLHGPGTRSTGSGIPQE